MSCTRDRLTSASCWAKNKSRRKPLASSGTMKCRNCDGSSAIGNLPAADPEKAASQHHRRSHELSHDYRISADDGQQGSGKTAEKEPNSQYFPIVMRTVQQP